MSHQLKTVAKAILKREDFFAMGFARLVGYQSQMVALYMWLEPTCK